jgi:macrodomain Ter protein organizer (MatP/YcbG family)
MNEKNHEKRKSASLNKIAHQRLKGLAKKRGFKLNHLIDEAVWQFLKREGGPA